MYLFYLLIRTNWKFFNLQYLQEEEEGGEEQTLSFPTEKTLQEVNKSIPKLNVPTM
jgi:hypothetical protein